MAISSEVTPATMQHKRRREAENECPREAQSEWRRRAVKHGVESARKVTRRNFCLQDSAKPPSDSVIVCPKFAHYSKSCLNNSELTSELFETHFRHEEAQ